MDSKAALKYLQSVVRDTTPEMLLLQQEIWQKFSNEKKLLLTMELMDNNMELLRAGIVTRHPEWSREEVRIEILKTLYKSNYTDEEFAQMIESFRKYNQKISLQNNNKE